MSGLYFHGINLNIVMKKQTQNTLTAKTSASQVVKYNKEAMDFAITALAKNDTRFGDTLVAGYFFFRWKYQEDGRALKPTFNSDETWSNACFTLTEDEQLFFDLCNNTRVVLSVNSITEKVRIQSA